MFTGIVEEVGSIERIQKGQHSAMLTVHANTVLQDTRVGDSIAVNGVCLTVTSIGSNRFTADIMHETLERSAFKQLGCGSHVNLERAMAANGRFGGHIVSGHVDGMGKIVRITRDDNAVWYTIQASPAILRYIVEKGSITIDGISLTVAKVNAEEFAISAIPHTIQRTTLQERRVGDWVNLENDIVGKYIERFLQIDTPQASEGKITREFLAQHGF